MIIRVVGHHYYVIKVAEYLGNSRQCLIYQLLKISGAGSQAHGEVVVGIVAQRGSDGKFVFVFRLDRYAVVGIGNVNA